MERIWLLINITGKNIVQEHSESTEFNFTGCSTPFWRASCGQRSFAITPIEAGFKLAGFKELQMHSPYRMIIQAARKRMFSGLIKSAGMAWTAPSDFPNSSSSIVLGSLNNNG